MSDQASAGAGGAPCTKDWDRIVWDASLEEAAVYLWTGSALDTWAVVSSNLTGPQSFYRDHWDGSGWTRTSSDGASGQLFENQQIWATDRKFAVAGASQQLQRWAGRNWEAWQGTPACHAAAGTALVDLWCATDDELWHFDGKNWTSALESRGIRGILAKARDDVWVWGSMGAIHFDGTRFRVELSEPVRQISASGPRDVWAVQNGDVLHSSGPGSAWRRQNPTGALIASVWSESPSNTWIVAAGAGMRWNGSSWALMDLPMQDERLLISGSAEDLWIAGTQLLAHGRPACR